MLATLITEFQPIMLDGPDLFYHPFSPQPFPYTIQFERALLAPFLIRISGFVNTAVHKI